MIETDLDRVSIETDLDRVSIETDLDRVSIETLSDLAPYEVLDFYDYPRLYSLKDNQGELFLVYELDGDVWLYAHITRPQYEGFKSNKLKLFEVMLNPSNLGCFVVTITCNAVEIEYLDTSIDLKSVLDLVPDFYLSE